MLDGIWTTFCDYAEPSQRDSCGKPCQDWVTLVESTPWLGSALAITPCARHAVIVGTQLFFLVLFSIFLLSALCRTRASVKSTGRSRVDSSLLVTSSCWAAAVAGFGNVGLAAWLVAWNWKGTQHVAVHEWAVAVAQGCTWIILASSAKAQVKYKIETFLRIWWIIAFLLGTFDATLSAADLVSENGIFALRLWAVLSWPVYCMYLLLGIRGLRRKSNNDLKGSAEEPLLQGSSSDDNADVVEKSGENITPFATAGIVSRAAFFWLDPLLRKGYRQPLEHSDVPSLGPHDRSEAAIARFIAEWKNKKEKNPCRKPTVLSVLASCYWKSLAGTGFFAFLKVSMALSGPMLLNTFIKYASGVRFFPYDGYVIVLGLFAAKMLESLAQRQWNFGSRRLGMHLRSSLIGAIFRKELRLSSAGRQRHSTGEVVNYMVVDAYRVGDAPDWLHKLWTTPVQITIALAILSYTVQWATIAGLIVIICTMILNTPLARAEHRSVNRLMAAQDNRLRATSEALRNMKILKLQAWELRFQEEIGKLRAEEVRWLKVTQLHRTFKSLLFWMTPVFVSTTTFCACVFLDIPLNASNVFTALATLRIVQEPIRSLPDVIAAVIQAGVALGRITKFLQEDELQADAVDRNEVKCGDVAISMQKAVLSWDSEDAVPTLRNISVEIKHGQHVAVCGTVGAGKSTLLYSILGDIPKLSGEIKASGSIAYVAQTAWIQSGTIRDNILFGKPMDRSRYEETIRACALESDIQGFEYGDLTEIGERGINMSGGQKQRIQLARAVYQDADIYLLDDPFSAVDAHTGSSIFKDCVRGVLLSKTVVLVTHQVEFLPAVDIILLLKDGEIIQSGRYSELASIGSAFAELVSAHEETMNLHGEHVNDSTGLLLNADSGTSSRKEVQAPVASSWKNEVQLVKKEEQETGDSGLAPFIEYLTQARGWLYLLGAVGVVTIFLTGQVISNWWMASQVENPKITIARLVGVYSAINLSSAGFVALRTVFSFFMGMATSRVLYSRLMTSIFRSPMSFFDSTPLGRILSRVSSDLQILDNDVPMAFGFTISSTMNALTTLAVTAVVTWQTLIVVIPVIFINRWLQHYYLTSARQLMRINATSKSPVVNHFGETIAGATTIRAFGREETFKRKNEEHVNSNAAPFFHTISANEWLTQRLDFLCTCLLCSCALVMVLLPSGTVEPGFAGLVLTYGLSLNIVMMASVNNQCVLANHIISVERVKQYMYNEPEAPAIIKNSRPPTKWPSHGRIEMDNLQVRYRSNTPLVLRGITCSFEAGQRVGVVGRTGSGKTTLISSLFRLVEPSAGTITIDGLDISTIGLHDLRSRLSIIPQEPALFRGTVRFNMDPLGEHTDEDVWMALEKCQLGDVIRKKEEKLDYKVTDDGENWSVGQRQLFCLGRVLLKHNRILVLDEATASIDNTTDSILQKVIREEFTDSTVITVAHRIPTVIDSDMVMALNDGLLVEYDQPMKLLENSSTLFARLVAEYWSHSHHAL
ncbi:hypothetical protein Mapa_002384 [Marchantia paleacea]|nr:hypothetical protein Mapa_002384 [Marchantia paleacea]